MRITLIRPLLLALLVAATPAAFPSRPDPVDIGRRLELFVDRYLIDTLDGASLMLHPPTPAPPSRAPLSNGHYATVIKDGDIYRLYNRGGISDFDGDEREYTAYFVSTNGIDWVAPRLGLFELNGSRDNNAILANAPPFSHNFSPFLDTRPGVPPAERYKALAGTRESGLHAFYSADGVHWVRQGDSPVFTDGIFDSQNVSFWSDVEQRYVCYFRSWTGEGYSGLRTISRTTSTDFVHWSAPVALRPNAENEHLYTSGTHPYFRAPHLYIALPTRFMPDRGNATDIVFMTSRGGAAFDRTFLEAFIRPGLQPEYWQNRANYAALNVVPTGEAEMSIYVRGRRYVLRTDGFASVHAGFEGGEMVTRPLTFSGGRLVLNAATSASGSLRVEIQDEAGRPLPGYSLAESDPFVGDAIAQDVAWGGRSDVSALAGRPVRLRFVMQDADLYALRFE
ncbi:MAG: hypothetical protein R2834_07655 [Rhodothermales bacterium]